jgi:hypothetical protein
MNHLAVYICKAKANCMAFSLQPNYTDREAAVLAKLVQTILRVYSVASSARRIATAVNPCFLDRVYVYV